MSSKKNPKQQRLPEFPGWLLEPPENPTDENISLHSGLAPDGSSEYSEEWQAKTAQQAFQFGYIRLKDLVYIMAKEKSYNEILPKLWKFSGFDEDTQKNFPTWKPILAQAEWIRADVWYWLLCRWTMYETFKKSEAVQIESHFFFWLEKTKPLPLRRLGLYEGINQQFAKTKPHHEQSPEQYISLDEFKDYLKNIESQYFKGTLGIPLPRLLFLEEDQKSIQVGDQEFPQDIEDLIEKAIPEIERILSGIKEHVGFSRKYYNQIEEQIEDKWKDEALDCFDDNEEEFSVIKREYLEDEYGLYYSLSKSQESRDFRGKLFQKIIQDRFPNARKYGVQHLNNKYREILDRTRPDSI